MELRGTLSVRGWHRYRFPVPTAVDLLICLRCAVRLSFTQRPGVENPYGWDMSPGARGCTPQACSFRDHYAELKALDVNHLFGLSTQDIAYQREAVERLNLPLRKLGANTSDELADFSN